MKVRSNWGSLNKIRQFLQLGQKTIFFSIILNLYLLVDWYISKQIKVCQSGLEVQRLKDFVNQHCSSHIVIIVRWSHMHAVVPFGMLQLVNLDLQLSIFLGLHLLVGLKVAHDLCKFLQFLIHFMLFLPHPVELSLLLFRVRHRSVRRYRPLFNHWVFGVLDAHIVHRLISEGI